MSPPLFPVVGLWLLLAFCFGQSSQEFGSTEIPTTKEYQIISANNHGEWFSTEENAKFGTTPKEQSHVTVSGTSEEAIFITQQETTIAITYTSEIYVENTRDYVIFDPDQNMCNVSKGAFEEIQNFPDVDDNRLFDKNSNTTTCNFSNSANTSVTRIKNDPLVSWSTVSTVRFVTQEVIVPVLAFPGCVFNIISVYVLVKQGTESSSTRYLIALGVADLSFLCTSIVNWVLVLLNEYQYSFYVSLRLTLRYEWVNTYFSIMTGRYSNALVLLFSLDCFVAVKSPLKAKSSPLSRHSAKLSVALSVFLALMLMPNAFRSEFIEVPDVSTNKTKLIYRQTLFADSNPMFYLVYTYILLVTLRLVPVMFTFILNAAIVLVVKLSSCSRVTKHVTDEKRHQKGLKITRVLLTISLIFLICVTPGLIHSLISNFSPAYSPFGTNQNLYLVFLYMFPVLDTINSTANFFVYVLQSEKFRVLFLETFCHRFTTQRDIETPEEQMNN